jgi:hypothetical protein
LKLEDILDNSSVNEKGTNIEVTSHSMKELLEKLMPRSKDLALKILSTIRDGRWKGKYYSSNKDFQKAIDLNVPDYTYSDVLTKLIEWGLVEKREDGVYSLSREIVTVVDRAVYDFK